MERYDVIIRSYPAGREEACAEGFARVFGLPIETAREIVARGPAVAKRGLDPEGAERYRRALEEDIGARVAILPSTPSRPPAAQGAVRSPSELPPARLPRSLPPPTILTDRVTQEDVGRITREDVPAEEAGRATSPLELPADATQQVPHTLAEAPPELLEAPRELFELWVMGASIESEKAAQAVMDVLGLSDREATAAVLTAPALVRAGCLPEEVAGAMGALEARGVHVKLRSRKPSIRPVM